MNILVVCDSCLYARFGTSFVHAQAAAYAALGHRVRAIVPYPIGKRDWDGKRFSGPVRRWTQDGVEVFAVRYLSLSRYGLGGFNLASALRVLPRRLDKLLEGFAPEVVHAHTLGFDSEIGAFLKERLGLPLVVTTHGSDTTVPMNLGKHEEMRRLCGRADAVVAVSGVLRDRLLPCGTATPVHVIHNGFRLQHLSGQTRKVPCTFQQTGHLIELKKVDVTIHAFARIHAAHPEARLTLLGTGVMRRELEDLCRELGVAESVRFLGEVPNARVFEELGRTQFYVMPSVREGLPISYLEAMASGCITVGTAGEGISEIISSGENGFLVPPDDPEAIVRAVEWCLERPEEAAAIAERGRRDALELTWERNAKEYLELFERIRNYGEQQDPDR